MPRVVTGWLFPFKTTKLAIKVAYTLDDYGNLNDLAIARTYDKAVKRCLKRHNKRWYA